MGTLVYVCPTTAHQVLKGVSRCFVVPFHGAKTSDDKGSRVTEPN